MSRQEILNRSMSDAKEFQAPQDTKGTKAFLCTPQPCAKPCGAPCQNCLPCVPPCKASSRG